MEKAYIIENNLRLKEVYITKENSSMYLVTLGENSGFWINKKKVYKDMSTAYQELRRKRPELKPSDILPNNFTNVELNAVTHGL